MPTKTRDRSRSKSPSTSKKTRSRSRRSDGANPGTADEGEEEAETEPRSSASNSSIGPFASNSKSQGQHWPQENLFVHPALKVAVSGLGGILFGIALEKGRVFEPQIIRDQMLMRRFTMMKMFLAAAATGMVSFSLLSLLPKTVKPLLLAKKEFATSLRMKSAVMAAVGGGILGSGMSLAGSCPGMVLVQVGAGVSSAGYIIAGGMFGGVLYAASNRLVSRIFRGDKKFKQDFVNDYLNVSYITIAFPLVVVLTGVIVGLEYTFPWYTEVTVTEESVGLMKTRAWPPFWAGFLVGVLQIPVVLANQDTLGTTTSYITILSQVLVIKPLQRWLSYLKTFRWGWTNWWQVFFVGGGILGGLWSAQAAGTWGTVQGVSPWQAFGGGTLMIYGARLAGGCTSGHGLSGMGLLSALSFITVPAMFKGGIATAVILKFLGLPEFQ